MTRTNQKGSCVKNATPAGSQESTASPFGGFCGNGLCVVMPIWCPPEDNQHLSGLRDPQSNPFIRNRTQRTTII